MVEVSAGIIVSNNRILCFQKGMAKYPYLTSKWEFPGGKIEKGEQPQDALIRELQEELKLNVRDKKI